jgi:hypothetical protein
MKKLFAVLALFFSLLCLAPTNKISGVTDPASVAGVPNESTSTIGGVMFTQATTYLLSEDFEGTGYENSWTESVGNGVVDEDNTASPAPLVGSQSLRLTSGADNDTDNSTYATFSATDPVWVYFIINFDSTGGSASNATFLVISDGGANYLALYYRAADGVICGYDGSARITGYVVSADTTYHVWVKYDASSTCEISINTSATKPGSPTLSWSTGTTQTFNTIKFTARRNQDIVIDKARVSASEIGSDPT